MSNTSALVPYLFEGHRIRVSTDQHGEAWIVVADACAALAESPMVWAMANRRDEEDCLHSEEGPGVGGFTLALINEATLLRRLLNSDNPSAPRMRRWLTHELLPALQRRQEGNRELPRRSIEAIRRQTAAEALRGADEIIHLTGVSHAEALLSVLEEIQTNSSPAAADVKQSVSQRAGVAWLTADQLADRLDGTLRHTYQRLAAAGLQQRNEDDDWQLTEAGRDWGVALPLCSQGERRQQILWDPAVVALLESER
ncbi:BRO family protein [Synechococcus sp. CCY9201]|uniref:BRO-N domain-containing protein n=1 Tax=Synechococcus sp. CCY9201 TaxID=174697 RepID=UPI002B21A1F3|nr:BRO family protein [Synechococcus sp. CCY9201]MEA5473345.1 BRO family protein [Synechococcus sp. CCY9201]